MLGEAALVDGEAADGDGAAALVSADDAAGDFLITEGESFCSGKLTAVDPEIAEDGWLFGLDSEGYGVGLADREGDFNL